MTSQASARTPPPARDVPTLLGGPQLEMVKWLAFALMVVDHIPRSLPVPWGAWAWVVGRTAMPLFCLALGAGLALGRGDTSRVEHRLLLAAFASQPLYMLAFGIEWPRMNVLFTLLAGTALTSLLVPGRWPTWAELSRVLCVCPLLLFSDYGIAGAALVPLCYLLAKRRHLGAACPLLVADLLFLNQGLARLVVLLIPVWIFAVIVIRHIPLRLPRVPHLFYFAYPAHLAVLVFVGAVMRFT